MKISIGKIPIGFDKGRMTCEKDSKKKEKDAIKEDIKNLKTYLTGSIITLL